MRHFLQILAGWVMAIGFSLHGPIAQGADPDGFLARFQFIGADALKGNTNGTKWREVWSMPATIALREQTLDRLSRAPRDAAANRLASSIPDGAKLIRPLLNDLLTSECMIELGGSFELPELLVAAKLKEDQAKLWDKNLSKVISTWKAGSPKNIRLGNFQGWELKKQAYPNTLRFIRAGNWVLFALGNGEVAKQNALIDLLQKTGRPFNSSSNWIQLEAAKNFLTHFRWPLPPLDYTSARLNLIGRGENLRVEGALKYQEKIIWTNENWSIPTHLIRDPLISFTAARGVAPVLSKNPELKKIGLNPMPNQFYLWAQEEVPFLSFGAFPAKEPHETMKYLGERLPQLYNTKLKQGNLGEIKWSRNQSHIVLSGLPFVMPTLEADTNQPSRFVYAKLFPPLALTNAPPPGLFQELQSKPGLAYYDWEITQARLLQWRHMKQLSQLVPAVSISQTNLAARKEMVRVMTSTNLLAQKWLVAVGPKLGNSVTQLTMKNPHELSLVRSSHAGLTAFELVTLADWLERPQFPLFNYRIAGKSNAKLGSSTAGKP